MVLATTQLEALRIFCTRAFARLGWATSTDGQGGCGAWGGRHPSALETGSEAVFDRIVCVACSPQTQRERLRQRDWSDEEIDRRIAAQMSAKEKMKRADHVVWTDGPVSAHADQWDDLLARWRGASSTVA